MTQPFQKPTYIVFPKSLTYITDFQLFLRFSALLERTRFAAVSTDNVQKNLRQQGNGDMDYVSNFVYVLLTTPSENGKLLSAHPRHINILLIVIKAPANLVSPTALG